MLDFLHWVRDMEFDLIFSKVGIDLSDRGKHFEDKDWTILKNEGRGLFYSSYAFLGQKLTSSKRIHWSKWWGSSCQLFLIKPKAE
ncbi:MAG TPA: hypothetical protein PLC89_18295 [Haliscomenobacter sp.]|uniref:hypothetical protein n=1 Tax=Haliscomenobacter sp. TaxID=2717303 RepID=UPI002C172C00|nr:hypothetical protein [Haliscomenobacter sp.]HOY19265.1 hypothetical protein [Haliscomenobacter sp.]HPH19994.1 hypothetical protein [Haliscomenobacter sp.]